jgi:ubiquinone/menaquinone biosynthesis C-methylase UbiE
MKTEVRRHYARTAGMEVKNGGDACCGGGASLCCSGTRTAGDARGYTEDQLSAIPPESDMGLGCGNPTALGELRPGETVVDLGSGGGIDCFLAAKQVGPQGRVIGVDMTPEMIDRARAAAKKNGTTNVEFRLGEIESLPVADASVDVIISNCVINLSTEKERVFREAARVLKPGGRLMISDIMLREKLPERLTNNAELFAGCVAGAILKEEYLRMMREAGLTQVTVAREKETAEMFGPDEEESLLKQAPDISSEELKRLGRTIVSVQLTAQK